MMPTLRTGNVLMIRKTETFKRFDLVCYKDGSGKKQFRRIIGLPMEKIEYKEDTLYVANQPIDEKFIVEEINEALENGGHFTENFSLLTLELSKDGFIPENKYFLLGDNRPYSTDSRDFGFIDKKQIIGVVKMKILPINDLSAF